jgi:hypothetical protein
VKTTMLLLVANLVSIVLSVASAYLVSIGRDGWGWFLFIAALCAVAPTGKVSA